MHIGFIITDIILGLILIGIVIYKLIPKPCPKLYSTYINNTRNLTDLQQELANLIKENVTKQNENIVLKRKINELAGKISDTKYQLSPYIVSNA